jgi:hypothetical protein
LASKPPETAPGGQIPAGDTLRDLELLLAEERGANRTLERMYDKLVSRVGDTLEKCAEMASTWEAKKTG